MTDTLAIGVLALQGGFHEHITLLRRAAAQLGPSTTSSWSPSFVISEVRTPDELGRCDALVIPGGESTTMALVAERSGLLEPLREFVNIQKHPTWGTCAGLILLSSGLTSSSAKQGGQALIGALDVRVRRNHFGRQTESFARDLHLPFLGPGSLSASSSSFSSSSSPCSFPAVFIRAPVVEALLDTSVSSEAGTTHSTQRPAVEVLGVLDGSPADVNINGSQDHSQSADVSSSREDGPSREIVAVRQGHVFGTSFHPELTDDCRIHVWWLREVVRMVGEKRKVTNA